VGPGLRGAAPGARAIGLLRRPVLLAPRRLSWRRHSVGQPGEADGHRRPLARLALDLEGASELRHRLPHEHEAQGVQLPVERLLLRQQLPDLLGRHARAVVVHLEDQAVALDPAADVDHSDPSAGHGVHRVHDEVEVHAAKAVSVPSEDAGRELDPQLDAGAALFHHVPVDHVAREVPQVLRDVEHFVDISAFLLVAEVLEAVVDPADPAEAVAVVGVGPHGAGLGREEGQHLVGPAPERVEDQLAQLPDHLEVALAGQEDGLLRREVLDRPGVRLEGGAKLPGLGLELVEVRTVDRLRLVDPVDLEIRVDGDVVVDDLVEEGLDAQVVNQELDLGDVLLEAGGVVHVLPATSFP